MFTSGQQAAVASAFALAGYHGPLTIAPVTSDDERIFVLSPTLCPTRPRWCGSCKSPATEGVDRGAIRILARHGTLLLTKRRLARPRNRPPSPEARTLISSAPGQTADSSAPNATASAPPSRLWQVRQNARVRALSEAQ